MLGSGFCELGEVVGGADQRPFACHLVDATQEELPEASGLLDLSEDGLDNLLSEPVAATAPGAFEGGPHRLCQGAAAPIGLFAFRMLGAACGDVGTDFTLGE